MARKLTEEELSKVTGGDVTSANIVGYQATQFAGNTATQEGGAILPQNNGDAALARGIIRQGKIIESVR